ncbi:hypothetical protein V8E54_008351, partial [Elaphomyces granulatus]
MPLLPSPATVRFQLHAVCSLAWHLRNSAILRLTAPYACSIDIRYTIRLRFEMLIYALLPFLLRYLPMATWFTVIGRIAQIEGIADSAYKNALVEFEEGDSELSSCLCFYVAFWGDLLES